MPRMRTIILTADTITEKTMIDLHCHILPGIDDGAKTVEDSLKLLREEKAQGVDSIVFTPHFNPERCSLDEFIAKRNKSLKLLSENNEFQKLNICFKTGAEVYFSVGLADMKLDDLCFAGTDYILIELPVQFKPHGLTYALDNVINRGYTPIIAHVERYKYISENPIVLYDLVERGCLAHVNANAVLLKGRTYFNTLKYIKWGLVRFMCSDCHSIERRPPNLRSGLSVIEKSLGKQYVQQMIASGETVFNGEPLEIFDIKKPRCILGRWL